MTAGDISWVATSTALVMLMTPALGFFYAGLVRKKNLVSTLIQCLIIFAVISIVWALWGYSLVFGPSVGGVIGNLSMVGLNNLSISYYNPVLAPAVPELLFFAFQLKFGNYASVNNRRVRGENKVSFAVDFHCVVVDVDLCADCPLGLEP